MSMKDFVNTLSEEQKKALMDALIDKNNAILSHLPDEAKEKTIKAISDSNQEKVSHNSDFIVDPKKPNNNRRKEPVKARKNEWVDSGEDRHIETKYGARTPRNREPHKKADVECSVCGRSFKVDPKYIYGEYHRCSKCTGR